MPFDCTDLPKPPTARDHVIELRNLLRELPNSQFNYWNITPHLRRDLDGRLTLQSEVPICILGWALALSQVNELPHFYGNDIYEKLGLTSGQGDHLCIHGGWLRTPNRQSAIRALNYFLDHGDVTWSPFKLWGNEIARRFRRAA